MRQDPGHGYLLRSLRRIAALSSLVCACGGLTFAQLPSQPKHVPIVEMASVPRVVVPDVRGRQLRDAQTILEQTGLKRGSTTANAGPGIVGTVSQQQPVQNSVVPRGTAFNLVLLAPARKKSSSDGDESFSRQVPNLIGLTPNQASNRLESLDLQTGDISAGNGNGAPGTIYEQNPQAGRWVNTLSKIDIEVVESPKSSATPSGTVQQPLFVLVPSLLGQTETSADEILRKHNLQPGAVSTGTASSPPGIIFAQFPLPNSKVVLGTPVRLQIAASPPPQVTTVAVPNLI